MYITRHIIPSYLYMVTFVYSKRDKSKQIIREEVLSMKEKTFSTKKKIKQASDFHWLDMDVIKRDWETLKSKETFRLNFNLSHGIQLKS